MNTAAKEPLVSIIVPIYNAEKYLEKCIESIVNQTYTNIEIILVDDGSPDNSAILCDEYAEKDGRIKVVHKANGGVSSARNAGLDIAQGDYVSFVDADDWIEPNYCSALLAGRAEDAELVVAETVNIYEDRRVYPQIPISGRYSLEGLKSDFQKLFSAGLINTPCAKLYRAETVDGLRFDESVALGEDILFNLAYMEKCENIVFIPNVIYNYNRMSEDSATKKLKDGYFEQSIKTYTATKRFKYGQNTACTHDEIDGHLCKKVIVMLQMLCCDDRDDKKATIKKWLANEDVRHACRGNYGLSIKQRAVQLLCRYRCVSGIMLLFKVKKLIAK